MLHSHKNYGLPSLLILGALSACAPDLCSLYEGKQFAEDNQCGEGQSGTGAAPTGGSGGTGGVGANGGTGGNTGGDGGTGGGPPPGCTPTEGEVIGATCGVFVDANAPAGGSGSQANPYTSIAAAVQNVGDAEHIYVCGGDTHAGSISLPPGVALSGGLTCDTWTYGVANPKPLIEGDADEPGLSLVGAGETALTCIRIAGAAPAASGGSSIGLLASERTVDAQSIEVTAAAGNAGSAGADAPQTNALNGGMGSPGNNAPACNTGGLNDGGMETLNGACATGTSVGGKGGDSLPSQGINGLAGATGASGQGGIGQVAGGWDCSVGVGGGGNNGSAGSPGSPGSGKGALVSTGFAPAAGGPGGNGDPGQGGGGGGGSRGLLDCNAGMAGSQPRSGASGGSGGAGGCGGVGATGGTGGGSSFAVVLLNAQALFSDSTFTAADGGAGGDGGRGQPGAAGGFGANGGTGDIGNGIENACRGGDGGTGGRGGGGGGGRGGHSAAIVFDGTAPSLEDSTPTPGVAGAPGAGLGLNPGDAGLIGTSCGVMDFTGAAEACL